MDVVEYQAPGKRSATGAVLRILPIPARLCGPGGGSVRTGWANGAAPEPGIAKPSIVFIGLDNLPTAEELAEAALSCTRPGQDPDRN